MDTTASDGRSAVQRTLGPSPGPQITTASAEGLSHSPVTFEDTAVAATAPTMSIATQPPAVALDQEVWVPESQPVVNVRDEAGNALPGVGVAAQLVGGGTLEGDRTATTRADGSARVYSLTFSADGAGSGATATSSQVVVDPLPPVLPTRLRRAGRASVLRRRDGAVTLAEVDAIATRGRGAWRAGPKHRWPFERDYGSAAMYEPGKILYAGGGGDPSSNEPHDADAPAPTATAETIDLNASAPQWQSTGDMHFARRHLNATVLPDGRVLVTGGVSAGGFNTLASAVHAAEVWDPVAGQWTELTAAARDRGYHSVALLLPDATVLAASGGDADDPGSGAAYPAERNDEIHRPPYLYKGARPIITGLPGTVGYGQTFTVASPNSRQILAVRWIRLGSVTHAFNGKTSAPISSTSGSAMARSPLTRPRAPTLPRRVTTCCSS